MSGRALLTIAIVSLGGYRAAAASASAAPSRVVPVDILLAGSRGRGSECAEVRAALEQASRDFQREFGIRFAVSDCSPSPEFEPGAAVTRSMLERLSGRAGGGRVTILAVPGKGERRGLTDVRRGVSAIFVGDAAGPGPKAIFEHELGHLFGAVHVGDPSSPMHPQSGSGPFNPASRRLRGAPQRKAPR